MPKSRIILCCCIIFGLFFTTSKFSSVYAFQKQTIENKKVYPKTYREGVSRVIEILDKRTKILIKDSPKFNVHRFSYIIHDNNLLDYKDSIFLNSCAERIERPYVHFEDVTTVILQGVWDELNSDLKLIDFDKTNPKEYFNSIYEIIKIGKNNKRLGYLSSLPSWIFEPYAYYFGDDVNRYRDLLRRARLLSLEKTKHSYLGLLYLSHFSPNLDNDKKLIEEYYKISSDYFEIPSLELNSKNSHLTPIEKQVKARPNYTFSKTSYDQYATKCFGIIYNKNFNSVNDYEKFLDYCDQNYLAKWKFLNTLTVDDYKILISEPRKLLEILTLTEEYYFKDTYNSELFDTGTRKVKSLIDFIEITDTVSSKHPYLIQNFSKYYDRNNEKNNKTINALQIITNKLGIEEVFDIINPKSIEEYNRTIKTDDFIDYKYLISFIIVSRYEELLAYPDKERTYKALEYYWDNEFISWAITYFVGDLLIQINSIKTLKKFKVLFSKNPENGSFKRHAVLASLVNYDFEENSKFIEDWYWTVQNKDFNNRPREHEYILELLKGKSNTLELYNKITQDIRYKE